MPHRMRLQSSLTPILGAAIGLSYCIWIVSLHLLNPTEVGWLMRTDWHFQFLSWHLFRNEPWQWPPGRVDRFYHLIQGTSIGYTDSIPLVAFALKPFSALLPMPFHYISLWWLVCYAVQGCFGVLLMRIWTRSVASQLLGAAVVVLMPILLARLIHPSLCAQWTILWALWLYFHPALTARQSSRQILVLACIVGFIHPYLAAMVMALLFAVVLRHRRSFAAFGCGVAVVLAEWWLSGLFLLPAGELTRGSLSDFPANLLAIITGNGWSRFTPQVPALPGQEFEGFQYLGAGGLLIVATAIFIALFSWRHLRWRQLAPLGAIVGVLAIYALSPRVTFGSTVVLDYSSSTIDRVAFFRVAGRFFWPFVYTTLVGSLGLIVSRLPRLLSTGVLMTAVGCQVADLQPIHAQRRALARDPAFSRWTGELRSPVWAAALPHYDKIVLFHSVHCGPASTTFEGPSYLAGFYGLSINDGISSRWSTAEEQTYCQRLTREMLAGQVEDAALYLVHRSYEQLIRKNAPHLVCGDVDSLLVCVTSRSYQYWRNAAEFR